MKSTLPVVETFHSLQGEGAHAGTSAFFIRLASCKVGCPWCDTKNSWEIENHPEKTIYNLAIETAEAASKGASFVVLTGGEPLHHNLDFLCKEIRKITNQKNSQPLPIHLETSGVNELTGHPNWITLSPKRHAPPRLDLLKACNEIKIVIQNEKDLSFAQMIAQTVLSNQEEKKSQNKEQTYLSKIFFLQPGWNNIQGQQLAIEFIKKNPLWRLSLQTHKWLGVL